MSITSHHSASMLRPLRSTFLLAVLLVLPLTLRAADPAQVPAIGVVEPERLIAIQDGDAIVASVQVGSGKKFSLSAVFADGTRQVVKAAVEDDVLTTKPLAADKPGSDKTPMPDAYVRFTGPGLNVMAHSRPRLLRYTDEQQEALAATWESLPAASQRWYELELRTDPAGAQLWIDGRYSGLLRSASTLHALALTMQRGGAVRDARALTHPRSSSFLPLDVRHLVRPGVMRNAVVSLKPGMQTIAGVPLTVVAGTECADVGMAKECQGLRFLETDQNTSRTALDGMPESLHYSVPQEFYQRAWVLCAVDPDPKKDPVLTTRLTRFGVSGRGGAIADTTLTLPRGDGPLSEGTVSDGIRVVGNVAFTAADGRAITTPLLLVRVDLRLGEILDLLADEEDRFAAMKIGSYLDLEFLGKMDRLHVQVSRAQKPLRTSTSAVHLFGVTLEKAPAELRLKQAQHGNIFHNDEVPETTVAVRANEPGTYAVHWTITDDVGKTVHTASRSVDLTTTNSVDVTIPLQQAELGWYGLRIAVQRPEQPPFISHDAAFALLGQDTRRAGYESPYGTWWFGGAHYSERRPEVVGPLLHKAGMRRIPVGWTQDSEAEFAPWKVGLNQQRWRFRVPDLDNWEAATARVEAYTREMLQRFPHCTYVDIFHESFANRPIPPELFGVPPPTLTPEQEAKEAKLFELGMKAAKFYRERFPQLKLIVGNSGGSSTLIAMLMRRGFPREYIDYLGSETTGQAISPEKMSPHTTAGIWLMQATARHFFPGEKHDIPLTGSYEYTARPERDLGPQRAAEWYARDMLVGLAFRFPTVSPGLIADVSGAYYQTLWGASGLCQRNPLHYPKRAYVALATLTKVLDRVTLLRQVPSGTASVNVLEFARGDERIYALWTARGTCEVRLDFPSDTTATQVEFYGRSHARQTSARHLTISASPAVTYLVSRTPISAASPGVRAYPLNQPPPYTQVVATMADPAAWTLAPDDQLKAHISRRPGTFTLRPVEDEAKGRCLELALSPAAGLPDLVGEYTTLRPAQPHPIAGRPHTVGVWVKGNSNGGRIIWELEDAQGERWRSILDSKDEDDWANQATIDFDGWCFVTFPLTDQSPYCHLEPGSGLGQWSSTGGDRRLDYPLKLVGLTVVNHSKTVHLTEMKPVSGSIRLKDVCVIGD